jgi:uncharacterized protein (DUF58 family)
MEALLKNIDRSAWLRFFGAVAGLSLALFAALYSTVFRESGDVWATAVLASLALIISGVVAVTTLPYLARRVGLRHITQSFHYEFTTTGAVFLLLIIVIGIAALNTGNNLLFIIVSAMLAAILVSGLASALVLSGLELDILLPIHVFARRKVLGRVRLHNTRRLLPAISVSVTPGHQKKKSSRKWQRVMWSFPPWQPAEQAWLRLNDWVWRVMPQKTAEDTILAGAIYFPYIAVRGNAIADVELRFERRGRYVQDGLGLATRFPFSFLTKTLPVPFSREIVVYPPIEQIDEFFEVLPLITGEFQAFVRGRGYDLYRIREYMPEDTARHVDWKATAKTGGLKVREFTREDERKLRIVFDNPAPTNTVSDKAYENAVSLAASLAWHFAGEDAQLSFAAPHYSGHTDVYEFLKHLALITPEAGASVLDTLEVTDDYNVIFTARSRGTIPTNLWSSSYFIFMEAGANSQLPSTLSNS